jgi:hypothetical protein
VALLGDVGLASPGELSPERSAGRTPRRLSKAARGKIDGSGQVMLGVKLTRRARKALLGGGELRAESEVRIKEPRRDGGRRRVLRRVVTLVRTE